MRPKFVTALFVVTGIVLAAVFYFKRHVTAAIPQTPPAAEIAAAPVQEIATNAAAKNLSTPVEVSPPIPVVTPTAEERQAAIDAEVERLGQLGMSDAPADLTSILAELNSPEKDIREAAIEAAKQFGSTNAIPVLQNAAANSADPKEQAELLEAAEFLALPSLNSLPAAAPKSPEEIQAKQQKIAAWQAAKQARLQKQMRTANQNPQTVPVPDQNSAPPPNN